jgi:Ca2+-binding EF-hand superfamily protein
VSQTPDVRKLFKDMLSSLGKGLNEETMDVKHFIGAIGEFLQKKRYQRIITLDLKHTKLAFSFYMYTASVVF